ncbi:MAG: DUF421 domain-containing protein [Clostridia bacterium]|nr:DUF421 domain-containing protein [Clostridia bacterium]
MDIFKLLLTAGLSVVALFVITKIMGHKQVAQLDFFDYVSGITIGSIGAELATELEEPWKPLIALIVWGAASLLLNFITSRLPRSRKYINGAPTILMHEGKIYRENLKKARLDLSEFLLLCRERGFFDLEDIQTAVFEHNGKLSVLPRSARRPATPEDLKIATREAHIGVELIMDGRIMGENLSRIGRDEGWLRSEIKRQGYSDEGEVFLAIFRESEGITVYPYK